jgi:hypothetical protein
VLLAAALAGAHAVCPNRCSGHGNCVANDLCACFPNWQGQDCSARTCAYDFAWVPASHEGSQATTNYDFTSYGSGSTAADFAFGLHYYAECSNKGTCDRKTGTCKCNAGYEGKACRRSTCPADCSGHGTCETIDTLSGDAAYKNWDTLKIQGCSCDPYYSGHDCSARMCPKGNDPLTTGSQQTVIEISLDSDENANCEESGVGPTAEDTQADCEAQGAGYTWYNGIQGTFTLSFKDAYGATWETWAIAQDNTVDISQSILEALEGLPNRVVEDVLVSRVLASTAACSAGTTTNAADCLFENAAQSWNVDPGVTYKVTFAGATNSGSQANKLTINDGGCDIAGCQPRYAGLSAIAGDSAATGTLTTGTSESTPADSGYEGVTCGNRGDCDSTTGLCTCHSGYTGEACTQQTALA